MKELFSVGKKLKGTILSSYDSSFDILAIFASFNTKLIFVNHVLILIFQILWTTNINQSFLLSSIKDQLNKVMFEGKFLMSYSDLDL